MATTLVTGVQPTTRTTSAARPTGHRADGQSIFIGRRVGEGARSCLTYPDGNRPTRSVVRATVLSTEE